MSLLEFLDRTPSSMVADRSWSALSHRSKERPLHMTARRPWPCCGAGLMSQSPSFWRDSTPRSPPRNPLAVASTKSTQAHPKSAVESDCRAGARASRVARRKRPARRRSALPQKKAAEETPAASLHEDRPTLSGRTQPRHRGRFPSGSSALRKLPVLCPHWRSCQ